MNKKLFISLLMIGVMAFGAGLGTYAWFTSSDTVADNVIQSGTLTVDLKTNLDNGTEKPIYIGGKLVPGDTITKDKDGNPGYATIEIVNSGNTDLFYFDNFVLSGNKKLAEAIVIKNWKNRLVRLDGSEPVFDDHFIKDGVFQWPYDVDIDNDGSVTLAEWLADTNAQMGPKNGWDLGALKPGYKLVQEFEFIFDKDANDEYEGLSLNGAFKVVATQYNAEAINNMISTQGIPYPADASELLKTGETTANRYALMH